MSASRSGKDGAIAVMFVATAVLACLVGATVRTAPAPASERAGAQDVDPLAAISVFGDTLAPVGEGLSRLGEAAFTGNLSSSEGDTADPAFAGLGAVAGIGGLAGVLDGFGDPAQDQGPLPDAEEARFWLRTRCATGPNSQKYTYLPFVSRNGVPKSVVITDPCGDKAYVAAFPSLSYNGSVTTLDFNVARVGTAGFAMTVADVLREVHAPPTVLPFTLPTDAKNLAPDARIELVVGDESSGTATALGYDTTGEASLAPAHFRIGVKQDEVRRESDADLYSTANVPYSASMFEYVDLASQHLVGGDVRPYAIRNELNVLDTSFRFDSIPSAAQAIHVHSVNKTETSTTAPVPIVGPKRTVELTLPALPGSTTHLTTGVDARVAELTGNAMSQPEQVYRADIARLPRTLTVSHHRAVDDSPQDAYEPPMEVIFEGSDELGTVDLTVTGQKLDLAGEGDGVVVAHVEGFPKRLEVYRDRAPAAHYNLRLRAGERVDQIDSIELASAKTEAEALAGIAALPATGEHVTYRTGDPTLLAGRLLAVEEFSKGGSQPDFGWADRQSVEQTDWKSAFRIRRAEARELTFHVDTTMSGSATALDVHGTATLPDELAIGTFGIQGNKAFAYSGSRGIQRLDLEGESNGGSLRGSLDNMPDQFAICVKSSGVANAGCSSWNGNEWGDFGVDSAVGLTYSRPVNADPARRPHVAVTAIGGGAHGDLVLDIDWEQTRADPRVEAYGKIALFMETHRKNGVRRGAFGLLATDPLHGNLWTTNTEGKQDRITFSHPEHGGIYTSVQGRKFLFAGFDGGDQTGTVFNCQNAFSTDIHGWGGLNDGVLKTMVCG